MKTCSLFVLLFFLFLSNIQISAQAPIGVATPANQTTCSDDAITEIVLSTSNGMDGSTSYEWTRDNTDNITGIASSGTGNITGTLHNLTELAQLVTFTITPASGGTDGDAFTATITINPLPAATNSASDSRVCELGPSPVITFTGIVGTAPFTFYYTLNGGAIQTITSPGNNEAVINVPTDIPGTFTYDLVSVEDANGCIDVATGSAEVTIVSLLRPNVTIGAIPGDAICEGTSVTFSGNISNAGTNPAYEWFLNGISTGVTTLTYTNSTLANADQITLQVTSDAECPFTTTSNIITMSVNPSVIPIVSITGPTSAVCPGVDVTFSVDQVLNGGVPSYQWFVNGNPEAGATGATFTTNALTDGAVVTVELTSNIPCAINPATSNAITIETDDVLPDLPSIPIPQSGQANSICPVATGLVYSIPDVQGATDYIWNFPAGWTITTGQGTTTVTVTAGVQTAGIKEITVSATNSCGASTSPPLEVTVGTFAYVDAGPDQTVCAGTTVVELEGAIDGATGTNDWIWSAPDGTFNPDNKQLDADYQIPASIINGGSMIITISAEAEGTCPDVSDQMTITVQPNPTMTISVSGSSEICEGASSFIRFSGTPSTTVTYNVNGGSDRTISLCSCGSSTLNTGTLDTTTTFSLKYVAYTTGPGCSQPASGTATITVNPLPTADAGPDQEICLGESTILSATGGISYAWDNGVTNGIPFNPTTTTDYNVIVTDDIGCSDQDQVRIVVKPVPQTPTITFISDTLFSDSDLGNQWYVDENLIADAEDSFHKPTTTGTYYTIVTEDGCESEKSNSMFVQITGLEENENSTLNIYPNPAQDIITIETEIRGGYRLMISASNGRTILQKAVFDPVYSVDLSSISEGVYFITVTSRDILTTRKIIKQ